MLNPLSFHWRHAGTKSCKPDVAVIRNPRLFTPLAPAVACLSLRAWCVVLHATARRARVRTLEAGATPLRPQCACHTHPTIAFHPTDMTHDLPATLPRSLPHCSLIGAPTDIGAGARGASMGPEALRVAGL